MGRGCDCDRHTRTIWSLSTRPRQHGGVGRATRIVPGSRHQAARLTGFRMKRERLALRPAARPARETAPSFTPDVEIALTRRSDGHWPSQPVLLRSTRHRSTWCPPSHIRCGPRPPRASTASGRAARPRAIASAATSVSATPSQVVRIDNERLGQLTRRTGKAAQQQHSVLVVARRHELLGHQVHAVVQAADVANVCRPIVPEDLGRLTVPIDETQRADGRRRRTAR